MADSLKRGATLTVEEFVAAYREAEDASSHERRASEQCRDYYDGKQWSDDEIATLRKRGQPVVTANAIKRKVDFLRGFMAQQNLAPKALPRTPKHEDEAHAATDALRYVADVNEFDDLDEAVFENRCIEGLGAVEIYVEHKRGEFEIVCKQVPWDRLYRDPHARQQDFSDATYLGYVIWMDQDEAERRWPKAKDVISGTLAQAGSDETYEDRPHWQTWADGRRRRVKVSRHWFRKAGEWHWCTFTAGGFLDQPQVSPYRDENDETECPIVAQSAYVDRENRRYGIVHDMIPLQDETNKRRSKALHLLNSRQTAGAKGSVQSIASMKRELARPDGHIEVEPDADGRIDRTWQILPTNDLTRGQFELLQQARDELEAMGPNASLLGKDDKDLSGKAIRAQQQGGMIEISGLTSGQRAWRKRCYRAMWNRIRQFWTRERWVRVTDDDSGVRFVGLNQPVTVGDMLAEQGQMIPAQFAGDPRLGQVVGVRNSVAELDVDIILEEGIDPLTMQEEAFEGLMRLAEVANSQGQPIPVDILAEMVPNLRNREALIERLKGGGEQVDPMQQQMQQMQAQLAQQDAVLTLQGKAVQNEKTQAETQRTIAEAAEEMSRARAQASGLVQ